MAFSFFIFHRNFYPGKYLACDRNYILCLGRCFKLILKAHDTSVELITTGDFMSRFCCTLNLPRDVQKCATHIAKKAVDLDIVPGRSPISVAAAAIYMASQASEDKRTQREIADIAGKQLIIFLPKLLGVI